MADQFACVTFDTPAASGNLDVTSPSITETFSCAILIFTRYQTDDANQTHGVLGVGFVSTEAGDAANNHTASCCTFEDGVASSDCDTDHTQIKCIDASDGTSGASFAIQATYVAAVSGGVTLAFTVTGGVRAKCTAILFAGLSRSAIGGVGSSDAAAALENVGDSGVGYFEPDLVVFSSSDNALGSIHANGRLALGFAANTSPVQQVSAYINSDDSTTTTDSDGYIRSDCCSSGFIGTDRTAMDRFQVTTFAADGFNHIAIDTGGANSPQANYLALKFSSAIQVAALNVALTGSVGSQATTAVGFRPALVFGMSTLLASVDTLTDGSTASSAGYFAFTEDYERAYTISHQEGRSLSAGTRSVARTRQGDHAVLTLTHDASVAQQASLTSLDSSGFTLNFSTATAGYLTLMALGFFEVDGESVEISDGVVLDAEVTTGYIIGAETVEISEASVFDETDIVYLTGQEPLGRTAQAGAQRGSTAQAGPQLGRTL